MSADQRAALAEWIWRQNRADIVPQLDEASVKPLMSLPRLRREHLWSLGTGIQELGTGASLALDKQCRTWRDGCAVREVAL